MLIRNRPDGNRIKVRGFTKIVPILMPTRTESTIFIKQEFTLDGTLAFIEEFNKTIPEGRRKLTLHQVFLTAMARTVGLRPRLKRMVKVSGIAVYPPQVEEVLRSHPAVRDACVVGVPDPYKMSTLRAFIVPAPGCVGSEALAEEILGSCVDRLNRWSVPETVAFRDKLPLTRVGKVAFTELEREARDEAASA